MHKAIIFLMILMCALTSAAQTEYDLFSGDTLIYDAMEIDALLGSVSNALNQSFGLKITDATNNLNQAINASVDLKINDATNTLNTSLNGVIDSKITGATNALQVSRIYNATNANEWTEIRGDYRYVYTLTPQYAYDYVSMINGATNKAIMPYPVPLIDGAWYAGNVQIYTYYDLDNSPSYIMIQGYDSGSDGSTIIGLDAPQSIVIEGLGSFVKAQAGTQTNLVITPLIQQGSATNTVPYTPTISTPITVSTGIIHVVSTNRIYSLSVSSPNSISNDLSSLSFDGKSEKRWEVWVNYLTTNSLSTQWDNRMDFGGYSPDLTVTGQYKFVCSSIDGTNIITKQIYPTVYDWTAFPSYEPNSNTPNYPLYWNQMIPLASTNSYAMLCCFYDFNKPCILKFESFVYTANGPTNPITIKIGMGRTAQLPENNSTTLDDSFFIGANAQGGYATSTYYVPVLQKLNKYAVNPYIQFIRPYPAVRACIYKFSLKQANELEIKAYNAGWRP